MRAASPRTGYARVRRVAGGGIDGRRYVQCTRSDTLAALSVYSVMLAGPTASPRILLTKSAT